MFPLGLQDARNDCVPPWPEVAGTDSLLGKPKGLQHGASALVVGGSPGLDSICGELSKDVIAYSVYYPDAECVG